MLSGAYDTSTLLKLVNTQIQSMSFWLITSWLPCLFYDKLTSSCIAHSILQSRSCWFQGASTHSSYRQTSGVPQTPALGTGYGSQAMNGPGVSAPWPRMNPNDVQRYTRVFSKVDTDHDGKITGEQARQLFLSWQLPKGVLTDVIGGFCDLVMICCCIQLSLTQFRSFNVDTE